VLQGRSFIELDDDDIDLAAAQVREAWGLGRGPIGDVILAMENAGIVVGYDVVGSAKMDGLCNWSSEDGRPYVLIAEDKYSAVRSRMDAAHELGHVLLHVRLSPDVQRKHHKLIEQQAWRFAGAFLMPSSTFSADIKQLTLNGFLAMKDRWKVAISAMIMRCGDLDIIDKEQKSKLFRNLNIRGWRKLEPLDDELGIERPRLLKRSIELINESGTRTRKEFLELDVGFDAEDVVQLANLPHGYFDNASIRSAAPVLKSGNRSSNVISFPGDHRKV
tara:strand:- start:1410 stop:2234 length:825 start_codon:yes stop_codon:yes gene_type:complete